MAADVFFHPLAPPDPAIPAGLEVPRDLRPVLGELSRRLGLRKNADRTGPWGLKTLLGPALLPPAVSPHWATVIANEIAGESPAPREPRAVCFDTLSITTRGLDSVVGQTDLARAKGYGSDGHGLPFLVADDPMLGPSLTVDSVGNGDVTPITLAAGLGSLGGLAVLAPLRPHPHTGFQGVLTALGLGLCDREQKLALHRGIRPAVDTPLCAGCGSCQDVCIFDAIVIKSGRAHIDHQLCTGCGECMNVCFMAGISPEDASGIPEFQKKTARTAEAAGRFFRGRAGYFSFLLKLDRRAGGAKGRRRQRLSDVGILAGTDPVAVDRAGWDLIVQRVEGPLKAWSGYDAEPAELLAEAERLGLGSSEYRLIEI